MINASININANFIGDIKSIKQNTESGPWDIVGINSSYKVTIQKTVKFFELIPAEFEAIAKVKGVKIISIEDSTGKEVFLKKL